MNLGKTLDEYNQSVTAWLGQSKKETAAVAKLQKAVANGNLRDVGKLYANAETAAGATAERAGACAPLEFDAAAYLAPGGGFLKELREAAEAAYVRLYEREGVIFCYPVMVHVDPGNAAVLVDKKRDFNIRPSVLAGLLKKLQSQEPKARPDRFIETLFTAYELVRASRNFTDYIDISLASIYKVLTLLPGADKDYTLLDFTRDIYFLDTSDVHETKRGFRMTLTASTVSRERGYQMLQFVGRDGTEKTYAGIKFTPGKR